jgi:hypothetical protein
MHTHKLPSIPRITNEGLVEQFAIYNTFDERFVAFVSTGVEPGTNYARNVPGTDYSGTYVFVSPDKAIVEAECTRLNEAYKPHARFHTVVSVVFNPKGAV